MLKNTILFEGERKMKKILFMVFILLLIISCGDEGPKKELTGSIESVFGNMIKYGADVDNNYILLYETMLEDRKSGTLVFLNQIKESKINTEKLIGDELVSEEINELLKNHLKMLNSIIEKYE